jgi:hypothetical protein
MKIRDLLVIIFTAIVALLVLGRAALADGSAPPGGAGGTSQGDTSGSTGSSGGAFPIQSVDWMCADTCAAICRDRSVAACAGSRDPECVVACYPVCANECYDECSGPEDAREPVDHAADPVVLVGDVDGGAP